MLSLKAHAVLAKVGYPEFILNDTFLNDDLKEVCLALIETSYLYSGWVESWFFLDIYIYK